MINVKKNNFKTGSVTLAGDVSIRLAYTTKFGHLDDKGNVLIWTQFAPFSKTEFEKQGFKAKPIQVDGLQDVLFYPSIMVKMLDLI